MKTGGRGSIMKTKFTESDQMQIPSCHPATYGIFPLQFNRKSSQRHHVGSNIPSKLKIFCWKACRTIFPTMKELFNRKVTKDSICLKLRNQYFMLLFLVSWQKHYGEVPNGEMRYQEKIYFDSSFLLQESLEGKLK